MPRRIPFLRRRGGEAVHQPERRHGVAAILHEGEPLTVGDEVAGDLHRTNQRAMRRPFVVEAIAVVVMADGVDAFGKPDRAAAARRRRPLPSDVIGGRHRIEREGVQDIGEHQLLMLLLVIDADLDQRRERVKAARRPLTAGQSASPRRHGRDRLRPRRATGA